MDAAISTAVEAWLGDPAVAEADKAEVRSLRAAGDEKELTDRFFRELEFGTGGMRGLMGAGRNRMNVYTVGAAAQGLATYLLRTGGAAAAGRHSVAIAWDCRRQSDLFARRVAGVMAANGITAHLFSAPRPTPQLSFAIRRLGCSAGVVITASHNPPAYNGLKVYWSDGGQVVPPHDAGITGEVRGVGRFDRVHCMEVEAAAQAGLVRIAGDEMDEAFLEAVQGSCLSPEACRAQGGRMTIVYTALHGTGGALIPEALRRRGFSRVREVAEQALPDGDFPTVKSPNPEEAQALDMAIALARREGAELVIGTDPDADRMGVAVRGPGGEFTLLTGNQIGALITQYLCEQLRRAGRFPPGAVVLSTVVSGDLMKEVARAHGAEVVETLTGFKWIAARVREYEAGGEPRRTYIFGAEESYGYMPCTFVRDKDAVTSAAIMAELAAVAAAEGQGVYVLLEGLYRRFGYFEEGARSVTLPGRDGSQRIQAVMDRLRREPPRSVGGIGVASWADLLTGEKRDLRSGTTLGRYDLPESDVILFFLEDGTKLIARPSGTEPKIKFYYLVREPAGDLDGARSRAAAKIAAIDATVRGWVEPMAGAHG
jgi:phosphoglucomutase